jgi:flagellar basal-body rod modification protein FlgD
MAGISDVTYAPVTPPANAKPASESAAGSMMDKDTFLKLLVAQLQHQDPTSPADSTQWTAQMAQFSTVEQLSNLAKTTQAGSRSAAVNEAVGLLGRTVSYVPSKGEPAITGKVEAVDLSGTTPTLTIAGKAGITTDKLSNVV